MKASSVYVAIVLSMASVHGCELETNCKSKAINFCLFNDHSCRQKETLNLQGKTLSGAIPVAFFTTLCQTPQGNAEEGLPAVKIKKVYLQNNNINGGLNSLFACTTVQEINLQGNPVTSNQEIKIADAVVTLNLESTSQTNVKWLQKVPNLQTLNLKGNQISDISPLATANKKITSLNLSDNQISDISKLATMTQITSLNLKGNQISDISPLASMTKIKSLDLRGNTKITDLSSLVDLTDLTDIKVDAALQKQASIVSAKTNPATKRSQLVSAEIATIQQLANANKAGIEQMKQATSTIDALTTKNQALEGRIITLERKLDRLNGACFATSDNGDGNSGNGNRRQLNSDCIPSNKDGVSASGATTRMLSVATAASVVFMLL